MKLFFRAPAKINWALSVLNKRDDGYHNIVSPIQCVSLYDSISIEEAEDIEVRSDLDLPAEENLVYRAAVLLKKHYSCNRGARIVLKKEIPVAAGLGGGSSDAAATLLCLNRLWRLNIAEKDLISLGAEIGSDIPFFIGSPFSLVEGRGEKLTGLTLERSITLLLVKPPISVSAAWAYSSYKTELTKKHIDIKLFCLSLEREDFPALRQMVFNDLEKAVIKKHHVIAEIKEMLLQNGAVVAGMSGSGPTVFGVFSSDTQARRASENMGTNWCRVVRTLNQRDLQERSVKE